MHWPTFPWTRRRTPAYKPGQWTTIAGAEGVPVGNLFFAGEHCSYDFQGYMNGARADRRRHGEGRHGQGQRLGITHAARIAPHRIAEGRRDGTARIGWRRHAADGRGTVPALSRRSRRARLRRVYLSRPAVQEVAGHVLFVAYGVARLRRRRSSSSAPSSGAASSSTPRTGVLGRIKQTGVMRVGMEPDAPPLHFLNDKKQEDGFDFRLAGKIAEAIGARRIEVVEADYDDLPGKLRNGDIDVIMAGYVPDPSVEGVVWSNGYLDFGLCMVVHESMASTYKSPSDLAGKRIAIYDDPAAERWVKENIPNAKIQKFSGDSGWFEAVEKDQAEALIYDYPFVAEEIKEHPRTMIAKYNLNQSKYAVGVPAGNFELVYEINSAIDKFKATPQYAALMKEYLSKRPRRSPSQ